jgi:hypothetical protein
MSVVLMWPLQRSVFFVSVIPTWPAPMIIGIGYIKPVDTNNNPL